MDEADMNSGIRCGACGKVVFDSFEAATRRMKEIQRTSRVKRDKNLTVYKCDGGAWHFGHQHKKARPRPPMHKPKRSA